MIENLMTAFAKEVIHKLQGILTGLKIESDVLTVIKIYLQIEYEINDLFSEIEKYFQYENN